MKFLVVHSLNENRYGSYQFNGVHSICYYSLAASKSEKILMLKSLPFHSPMLTEIVIKIMVMMIIIADMRSFIEPEIINNFCSLMLWAQMIVNIYIVFGIGNHCSSIQMEYKYRTLGFRNRFFLSS